ncbi:MAG: hypothetical protein V1652_03940 [bacterium]
MKIISPLLSYNEASRFLTRTAGYIKILDRKTRTESFVRTLQGIHYPRFHIYPEQKENYVILNLHLDQKQPRYMEAHAHNAEYDGAVVENEKNRLVTLLQPKQNVENKKTPTQTNNLCSTPWWKKIFGKK